MVLLLLMLLQPLLVLVPVLERVVLPMLRLLLLMPLLLLMLLQRCQVVSMLPVTLLVVLPLMLHVRCCFKATDASAAAADAVEAAAAAADAVAVAGRPHRRGCCKLRLPETGRDATVTSCETQPEGSKLQARPSDDHRVARNPRTAPNTTRLFSGPQRPLNLS